MSSKHSAHQHKAATATVDAEMGPPAVPSEDEVKINVSNLKKTRVQFQLHSLTPEDEDSGDYPQEALDMSCRVLNTLSALTTAVEDRCNFTGIPETEQPAVSPFVHNYTQDLRDCYVLVVQSEPLFKDLPKEGSMTTPRISRQDIGKSGVLLSPSKAKQLTQASAAARSSRAANTGGSGEFLRIHNFHDLDNHYSGLGLLKETKVECPDVRDGNGLLIHLREYSIKLAHAQFVEVKVYLKLWNIGKSDKDDATKCERLRSCNYQLIMCQMQLLPSMGYAKAEVLKGKRKASEELASALQAKKLAVASVQDNSMDKL
ncbi:uncharacterized protein BJ212DRAFT_1485037 [Suillus subaureus]|uniref:Uncharacterized protein n=1 Tax=Suillus subaureus TaxID=48587 RepID=A0A9P7E1I9_9AGAM|nr:uncharacterized protein BJ212DRAFT_1485037 [Suillus subaureus]KAG1808405.1 hypothetical protein BJ212DRAFT_1485037 [Suillus subaureus]